LIMSYLFYSDMKNNIVLHPDCVKLSPELGLLTDKEVNINRGYDATRISVVLLPNGG